MADVKTPELSVKWQGSLQGKKAAVLVADGFEQPEFDGPVQALKQAGATVEVLGLEDRHLQGIKGVHHFEPAEGTKADKLLRDASPDDYDLVFVPGGLASPDRMRTSQAHLDFVHAFMKAGKPTAMICHGPWLLADSGMAEGRTLTSWPAIRKDLERAGATWRDEPVVHDRNLVTSRKPDDVPAFSQAVVELVADATPAASERSSRG